MSEKRLLLAGASGAVGSALLPLARESGWWVRTLSRQPRTLRADDSRLGDATSPQAVAGTCDGVDVVFSCLGAPIDPAAPEKRSYFDVDLAANRNLLAEARRAGVRRFVYVSVHSEPGYAATGYVRAHETFVEELRQSGLDATVLRPTGLFSAFGALLSFARMGALPVIGNGSAKTNPIDPRDVARAAVERLESGPREIPLGGPEVLTRRQIAETIFRALGRQPRLVRVPAVFLGWTSRAMRNSNPRASALIEFLAAVSTTDCVAPSRGSIRLFDYLRERTRCPGAAVRPAG